MEVEEAWWQEWQAYGGFGIVVVVGARWKDKWASEGWVDTLGWREV